MELMTNNLNTHFYIQSEAEFNRARLGGFWEMVMGFVTGRSSRLPCLEEMPQDYRRGRSILRGIQDIPLDNIGGSISRGGDFTRRFAPLAGDPHSKERWRMVYTLAVSGKGFPPVDIYKMGKDYFVEDGHHRLSVARYLGWKTIHARIIEIVALENDEAVPNSQCDWGQACLCPQ